MKLKISKHPDKLEQTAQHSMKLKQTLELDGSPVAVATVQEPPDGLYHLKRKLTVCMMIQIARRGQCFYSSGEDILCSGKANLGIGESPIRNLDDFLVRKEKIFKSKAAARKLLDTVRNLAPKQGKYLAFSPLERASFVPGVVLFIGIPSQISRIIFLNAFETGEMNVVHGEPLCSGAVASPITTGKIGISFLDTACRQFGRYKHEEMVVGLPYQRLLHVVDNIDLSTAGTARPDLFLRLAENLLRRRIPDNSK